MRGAYDFEAWEWTNPLCCALVWGQDRQTWYVVDKSHTHPKDVANAALIQMLRLSNAPENRVTQWWAHNGGKFDTLFLVEAAVELGLTVRAQIAGGRAITTWISSRNFKHAVTLLDSYSVAQASLRRCVEDFALPSRKLFTEDDYSIDTRKWNKDKLREGCITDAMLVLELLDAIETHCESWGGKLGPTFSSSALSVVSAELATNGLEFPSHKGKQDINEWCHRGFYGGRVEPFTHKPNCKLIEYDVTSSYPWSASQTLPWELLGFASPAGLRAMMNGSAEGMIRAIVDVPEDMYIPPLPYRIRNGGIYFPTGKWEAVFPAVELRYAQSLGVTVQPQEGVLYTSASPFQTVVNALFDLKCRSKGAARSFAKLSLNGGCFGKFAQSPEREELLICDTEDEAIRLIVSDKPGAYTHISDDIRFLAHKVHRWPRHTHYALASYITAYSRILLHKGLVASIDPAYCDTDSIHCNAITKLDNCGSALGQWKVELNDYTGKFFAPKIYMLTASDGKQYIACKGFPVTYIDFAKVIKREKIEREGMRLLSTQARLGGAVGRSHETKRWSGRSVKRKPLCGSEEGATRPWRVAELEREEHECAMSPLVAEDAA